MPGVLATALLAKDLSEQGAGRDPAGRDLVGRWDRLRRAIGLPVPLGFEQQAQSVFGLDPAAPAAPDPGYVWDEGPLRELVRDAYQWCAS
jgi:hypothetical protein